MNREKNSELVTSFGDHLQLMCGIDAGSFAKRIDNEHLKSFCKQFNIAARHTEYALEATETYQIFLRNFNNQIVVKVYLLDHTVFLDATDEQWKTIREDIFNYLQNEWRKYMAKHIAEYRDHFNTTLILNQCENETAI